MARVRSNELYVDTRKSLLTYAALSKKISPIDEIKLNYMDPVFHSRLAFIHVPLAEKASSARPVGYTAAID